MPALFYEDVEPAELPDHVRQHALPLRSVSDVEVDVLRALAVTREGPGQRRTGVVDHIGDDDQRGLGAQSGRGRRADPTRAAGDERDLPVESSHARHLHFV